MDRMITDLYCLYMKGKCKAMQFLKDEKGDVNVVSIVVLIGVAVLLAILFKNQIGTLLQTLVDNITKKAKNDAIEVAPQTTG